MNFSFKNNSHLKDKNKRYYFPSFSLNLRVTFIVLLTLLIIFFTFFFKSSSYHVLYNNLSNEDERSIVSQLIHMNVPFKFNDNHSALLVPENSLQEVRINLSEQGLPKKNNVGFELLDQEKFGISQFNEQINYQRALEGELSRTIQQLNNIKTARVHIALPKPSLFIQDKKLPSASVILEIKPDSNINSNQISAIVHMVSGSISGLSIDNITIIDQKGRLLNNHDSFDNNVDDVKLKYSDIVEEHYRQRIENILIPLVGLNNVHAQVTAQINFDKRDRTEEKYKPNYNNDSKSIRSHQSDSNVELNEKYVNNPVSPNSSLNKLSSNFDSARSFSSKETSLNNLVNKRINNFSELPKSSTNQNYVINYELDRTILHSKLHIGDVTRLSAAVVINYIRDKNGDLVSLSPYQINKIENLIRAAIGFSSERGDSISVVSSLFVKPPVHIYQHVSFWNRPLFLNEIFQYGIMLVLLIALYCLYKVFFIKKVLHKDKFKDDLSQSTSKNSDAIRQNMTKTNLQNVPSDIGFSDLSKNNSHVVAMIIRKWMNSGDTK
ncbi:MAG: flagellar basal-body MS-ring/collar protein FliF [Buchnera aphidicola (Kaburagia rhusicola rhusicola)]